MRKVFFTIIAVAFCMMPIKAENVGVPSECEDVMLQAFYWNSHDLTKYGGKKTKWVFLLQDTLDITRDFDLVWLPPSTNSSGGVGYYPKDYSRFDESAWGTYKGLRNLIDALHRGETKVVADMVLNHCQSTSGWAKGFAKMNFGSYGTFQLTSEHICANDEAFTSSSSDSRSLAHGAEDTGTNDAGCRDLDHSSSYVQDLCKAYTKFMLDSIGFDGFRYDMVIGYDGKYLSQYNQHSQPYFSVGEYWESLGNTKKYLESAEYNTMVFDFPLKYCIGNTIGSTSYYDLKQKGYSLRKAGLSKYAVTFIDNHDTFERSDNKGGEFIGYNIDITKAGNREKLIRANAYILLMPGLPCVFYPHWVSFKDDISFFIRVRKAAGIHTESEVISESGSTKKYEATIQGHKGNAILRLGPGRDLVKPEGYVLVYQAADLDIYLSEECATDFDPITAIRDAVAEAPEYHKEMRNGQLVITCGDNEYDVLGRKL